MISPAVPDAADDVIALVRSAFAGAVYPGDARLRDSDEGEEPRLLERDFRGKRDWATLSPAFLDAAPDGYGSALSFFSDEALRFYLPAYLIADLQGRLEHADPVFHLTHGFTDASRRECVNPRRYGELTWFECSSRRFAGFDLHQTAAIVAYLRHKEQELDLRQEIEEALRNFWLPRVGTGRPVTTAQA